MQFRCFISLWIRNLFAVAAGWHCKKRTGWESVTSIHLIFLLVRCFYQFRLHLKITLNRTIQPSPNPATISITKRYQTKTNRREYLSPFQWNSPFLSLNTPAKQTNHISPLPLHSHDLFNSEMSQLLPSINTRNLTRNHIAGQGALWGSNQITSLCMDHQSLTYHIQ